MSGELALVITGACGMRLPVRFAELALEHPQVAGLHLVFSNGARLVLASELGKVWADPAGFVASLRVREEVRSKAWVWREGQMDAPIASGSHLLRGVVVLPCSAATACSLAAGVSRGLGQRVGDVALKQRWPLILGFRETPLSRIHLQALLTLTEAGAIVMPPIPAFYVAGEDLGSFVEHYCMRVFDLLGLPFTAPHLRWRGV
ncbi:MAG: UbiX family flavin prenyltransferase [Thermoanaerobaculum sp.]|nr:UbiX family flavin prenyltransferase [Thermoanaerobaculum sp.]MDW7967185.1 UbiX family flavin prenyltransferase [Thermoanaerobaculum sp.]